MMDDNIKIKTLSGFLWRFLERCGAQGVNFLVQIVLARLLAPELYGTIALVTVFTTILQIFVDSGMGNALIQKKNADDVDFSSVFYFNLFMCCVLYGIMFAIAPVIAEFYSKPELTSVVRVMSVTLIISGVKNVQQAYVSRNMLFKRFFFSTLGGTIAAAFVGIGMAYAGFGVWALVAQDITNKTIDTLVLWFTVKWRPKLLFSFKRLKGLVGYGWKLLIAAFVDSVYNNIRQLIIGRMYSAGELGLYNKGKQLPFTIVNNINTSIDSVLFPAMSSQQESVEKVKLMTRRAIKTSSYILWPLMMGLAFTAPSIVTILLTEKWLACVPFLRVFCITYAFYPIHTANLNAIKAMGRSDLILKLEIIKKVVGIVILASTMWFGVMVMAYSLLVTNILGQIINSWPNKKLLNYSYFEQIRDIFPSILLSLVACACTIPINVFSLPIFVTLVIQIMVAVVIYGVLSKVFKVDTLMYIKEMLSSMRKRKK